MNSLIEALEYMFSNLAKKYRGKRILVTGGQGFIGSALAQLFAGVDCHLSILGQTTDISWLRKQRLSKIKVYHGDITKQKTWGALLQDVDYLFHLAALEYNRTSYNAKKDFLVNTLSVLNLLEVCRKKAFCPKIIFSSSANLFGPVHKLFVNEKQRDNPVSLWSVHKLMSEHYLRVYAKQYGIKSVTLRLANVYGPTANRKAMLRVIVNKVIARALAGERLTLYANKDCMRDYIFLEDAVNAFIFAGASDRISWGGDFYIIGSGEGKSIKDVWNLIAEKVKSRKGEDVPIEVNDKMKIEPLDMREFIADTNAFQKATGWKPLVFLEEGIELTIEALISSISVRETRH